MVVEIIVCLPCWQVLGITKVLTNQLHHRRVFRLIFQKRPNPRLTDGGGDGHSHSWFTLAELKSFQAKQPKVKHSGLISPEQARLLDEEGISPTIWCQGSSVPLEHRTWEEVDNSLNEIINPLIKRAKDEFGLFSHEAYLDVAKKVDKEIRIVFWFDN